MADRGTRPVAQNEAGAAHAALLKQLNDTEESARAAAERAAKQLADAKQADADARAAAQRRYADAVSQGEARHAAAVEEGKVNVANTIARMERQKKGELEERASLHEQNVKRINASHSKVRGVASLRLVTCALRSREVVLSRRRWCPGHRGPGGVAPAGAGGAAGQDAGGAAGRREAAGPAKGGPRPVPALGTLWWCPAPTNRSQPASVPLPLAAPQRKELDQLAKKLHAEHEAAVDSLVSQHKRKADGLQAQLDTTTKRLADATSRGDMLDEQLRSVRGPALATARGGRPCVPPR